MKVALLYGGPSAEHEISLISAANVLEHLLQLHYDVIPIGIDKMGRCFYNAVDEICSEKSLPVCLPTSEALPSLCVQGRFVKDVDVVFPMVHGPLLEDGALQGLLEWCHVPYVGNDVLSSAVAMNKAIARQLITSIPGIQCAAYKMLSILTDRHARQACCAEVSRDFHFPVFVKPCSLGSSVGVSKVDRTEKLLPAIEEAFRFDETILIEEGLVGREIELAVLENPASPVSPFVSCPGEIKTMHPDAFYSYAAKYIDSHQTSLCIPAALKSHTTQTLQTASAMIFTTLKCKGMARVDFFVTEDETALYFNEANTIPGFTPMSMYPKLWEASGLNYPQLLSKLIELALARYHVKQTFIVAPYVTSTTPASKTRQERAASS